MSPTVFRRLGPDRMGDQTRATEQRQREQIAKKPEDGTVTASNTGNRK